MANKVVVFDRPHAIAWEPGQDMAGDGNLSFGGWIWRYDIHDTGSSEADVTLTYDWSAVPAELREHIRISAVPRRAPGEFAEESVGTSETRNRKPGS